MLVRVCLVTDDPALRADLLELGKTPDLVIAEPVPQGSLWETLQDVPSDVLLISRRSLPTPVPETLAKIAARPDAPAVIVLAHRETAEERGEILAAGCLGVVHAGLAKPALQAALLALINKQRDALVTTVRMRQAESASTLEDFESHNEAMQHLLTMSRRVASYDSSVLVLGETGTGKEHLARAMHNASRRAAGPFIAINCGALPESLLESMLFGHEKGAFTGAAKDHRGYFELAHNGTVFLDEIGEMPAHLQVQLLRVLQDREIQRLGAESPVPVDVRVMAATNRDLEAEMEASRFRSDLYYRLCVVTLRIPPLRERREDIPPLVRSHFDRLRRQMGRGELSLSDRAMQALQHYRWPGNIREVMNVLERAVMLCLGAEVDLDDLPEDLVGEVPQDLAVPSPVPIERSVGVLDESWTELTLGEARRSWQAALERSYLEGQLRRTEGRVGDAAARAGIDRRSLYAKMKHHGLRKEDYR